MDFTLAPEIEELRLRVRAFVEEHVLPLEADPQNFSEHENIPEDRLAKVREKARKAGIWAPQSPKEFGGMGLPIVAWAVIYEEAARSIFGPLAIHCMAPDDEVGRHRRRRKNGCDRLSKARSVRLSP